MRQREQSKEKEKIEIQQISEALIKRMNMISISQVFFLI